MKIAVIGAGIVGVTTAFELAVDGNEVTVFERRASVAEETSFANAGVVAPGYVTPWAAPGMPGKVARFLLSAHAPVRVSLPLSRSEMAWMLKWYRACDLSAYQANRTRMQRLAFYSRTRLNDITDHFQLEYDRATGYMVLLRGEKDRKLVQPGLALLRDGIQPGAVGIEHGYGHTELGARAHVVDGKPMPHDATLAAGVNLNDLGFGDATRGEHANVWIDWVSGAAVRQGLPARIERV